MRRCTIVLHYNPIAYNTGASTHDAIVSSSGNHEMGRERLSELGSPDSRLRASLSQRTPGLSERMSDMDALSIQMDVYDEMEGTQELRVRVWVLHCAC